MTTETPTRTTIVVDVPSGPVESCTHTRKHLHGTKTAYSTCHCRCTDCCAANNRYQQELLIRKRSGGPVQRRTPSPTDPRSFVPARERTPFGQFELKRSHLKTAIPGQEISGHYLRTRPTFTPEVLRAARLTVAEHSTNTADLYELLGMLGIGPTPEETAASHE